MKGAVLLAIAAVAAATSPLVAEHSGGTYKGGPNHEPPGHRSATSHPSMAGGQVAHRKNRAKGRTRRRR